MYQHQVNRTPVTGQTVQLSAHAWMTVGLHRLLQWGGRVLASLAAVFAAAAIATTPIDSGAYYLHFSASDDVVRAMGVTSTRAIKEIVPWLRMTGGGAQPCCWGLPDFATGDRGFRTFALGLYGPQPHLGTMLFNNYRDGACGGQITTPMPIVLGSKKTTENVWLGNSWITTEMIDSGRYYCPQIPGDPTGATMTTTTDELSFGLPVRRKALDGGEYDASKMIHKRNGLPWTTWTFGYHLGLTAIESNWDDGNLGQAASLVGFFRLPSPKNNFELTSLPPPWVEDDVVEYVNRADFPAQPDGQFFYTALASDKALLDAVPVWQRTGRAFKSGGYVSTCRFYGGKNGGPNTHFYAADAAECESLKQYAFLQYEGSSFTVNMPLPGTSVDGIKPCPIDSKALFRLYNNAAQSNGRFVSNHRYTTDRADVAAFVAKGWADEGQVMCVPM